MYIYQGLIFILLTFVLPVFAGGLFIQGIKQSVFNKILFGWVSGQIALWMIFQLIAVTFILREEKFHPVVTLFSCVSAIMAVIGLVIWIKNIKRREPLFPAMDKTKVVFGVLLALVVLFQLYQVIFMAYEEGDDAYYVAISTLTVNSDTMYEILPYTGFFTELDARHGLAPFPIWIAYISFLSGIRAVTCAHICLPIILIIMSYAIYYLIGNTMFESYKSGVWPFMFFISMMVLFGGYSLYSRENFLIVRTAQGKAVLGNIIIPFVFYITWEWLKAVRNNTKRVKWVIMLFMTLIAGCLCSTMGSLLLVMLLGVIVICAVFSYKRLSLLWEIMIACVIPVIYAGLYLIYR